MKSEYVFSFLFLSLKMVTVFLRSAFLLNIFINSFPQLPKIIKCIIWSKMYRIIQIFVLGYDLPNYKLAFCKVTSAGREGRRNSNNYKMPGSEARGLHVFTLL